MIDKHELMQVVNEFACIFDGELNADFGEKVTEDKFSFNVTINGKVFNFSHVLNHDDIKKQIKFLTKNDCFDALREFTGLSVPWGSYTGVRPVSTAVKLIKESGYEYAVNALTKDFRMRGDKAKLCADIALKQLPLLSVDKNAVDIYISIPFCVSRCSYCSFSLVGIEGKKKLQPDYVNALCKEIEIVGKAVMKSGYKVRSIYIGGGTPTALSASLLDEVLKETVKVFGGGVEFTLEAGRADTINEKILYVLDRYPVTRFNINPQSMVDATLNRVGRKHTSAEVESAFNLAKKHGYNNINMDIIAGLPGEKLSDFKYTVDKILELSPEAITVHTLALKRASSLKKQDYSIKGVFCVGAMLEYAYSKLFEAGYAPYYLYRQKNMESGGENVGFCKEGKECFYNIDIMEEDTHILALGSGGVSKRIREGSHIRRSDPKDIEVYIDRIDDTIEKNIEFFK